MVNEGLESLLQVWKMVETDRLAYYKRKGMLAFTRTNDGTVEERYFKTFEQFSNAYADLTHAPSVLFVDLSNPTPY